MTQTLNREVVKFEETFAKREDSFVHFYFSQKGYIPIEPPVRAKDFACPFCDGEDFHLYSIDEGKKAWMCGRVCAGSKLPSHYSPYPPTGVGKRALEWALFCELNGLGDLKHDITFEKIHQPPARVDYLMKFATHPVGVILMQGTKGSGKTYASLGVCEYFTRKNSAAIFSTQSEMQQNWLVAKKDSSNNFIQSLLSCNLLVIDDFGTGDIPPGFMTFFMELIEKRLQWSNRGTIITTNLDDAKFTEYCGDALSDRIGTGQKFIFKEKSRRKQLVL